MRNLSQERTALSIIMTLLFVAPAYAVHADWGVETWQCGGDQVFTIQPRFTVTAIKMFFSWGPQPAAAQTSNIVRQGLAGLHVGYATPLSIAGPLPPGSRTIQGVGANLYALNVKQTGSATGTSGDIVVPVDVSVNPSDTLMLTFENASYGYNAQRGAYILDPVADVQECLDIEAHIMLIGQ